MTKVTCKGEIIELCDQLEEGYRELDLLDKDDDYQSDLDNTKEINVYNLDDTQIIDLGEENE